MASWHVLLLGKARNGVSSLLKWYADGWKLASKVIKTFSSLFVTEG